MRALSALLSLATLLCCAGEAPLAHPRLILTAARLADIQGFIHNNSQAAAYFSRLAQQGEYVLGRAPLPRPPENATDILAAARAVLTRVYVTSLLHRLTGNETFGARAVAELLSFSQWADWDIAKHALDAGELSHAAAVALDWNYALLARNSTALGLAVAGMVRNSGQAFRAAYQARAWWACDSSNWAQVTNSGAGLAALALEGEEGVPAWAADVLRNATRGVLCSAEAPEAFGGGYAPDGAWWEGPIYSGYALRYLIPFATALATAKGDASLLALPGLALAPRFQMAQMDASYAYFNWADSSEGQETLAMLLGVADRAGDGAAAFTLRSRLDSASIALADIDSGGQQAMEYAHALLYFSPRGSASDRAAAPLDHALPAKKVALLRTGWGANASFLGVKACNCSWNHGDLDHGTFVFSAGGHRWIADLGADSYGLPGYFGAARYQYYRKGTRGHNTLQFNALLQAVGDCSGYTPSGHPAPPSASATFLASFASLSGAAAPAPPGHPLAPCALRAGEQACVEIDLTPAYLPAAAGGLRAVSRRVALRQAGSALVEDAWGQGAGAPLRNVTAAFHTLAAVSIAGDGRSARLQLPGAALTLALLPGGGCEGARLAALPVVLAPPQEPAQGLTRIEAVGQPGPSCTGWAFELAS